MCVKRCQNIFIWVKKRLVWGVLRIEEIRDKDNETSLKEGRRNRNVNLQCFPYTRLHALSSLDLLTDVETFESSLRFVVSQFEGLCFEC